MISTRPAKAPMAMPTAAPVLIGAPWSASLLLLSLPLILVVVVLLLSDIDAVLAVAALNYATRC